MNIFCGDIHGEFEKLIQKIKALDLRDCNIFQIGDFGVGFVRKHKQISQLHFLNNSLKVRNIMLYAFRGNHDDPIYFSGNDPELKFSNIILLPDYSVLSFDDKKILFIGGAISVDRLPNPYMKMDSGKGWKGRKQGSTYWKDEKVVFKPEKLENLTGINIVATHTSPSFTQPLLKTGAEKWFETDETLEEELNAERNTMTDIYNILCVNNKISTWVYGHYHFSNVESFNDTTFRLLDIMEFYELR